MDVFGPGFVVLGSAQLPERVVIGDHAEVELEVRAGRWVGQVWTYAGDSEKAQLVLVHADYVSQWADLIREAELVGTAGTDCAQALIYDAAVDRDELYEPVEPGLIAGKGFSLSIGGDGDYDVRGTSRDGALVCLLTGNELDPLEHRLFLRDNPERACTEVLATWRANATIERDLYADPITTAIELMPATPSGQAELARTFEVANGTDEAIAIFVATRLAKVAPDPMPHFHWIVENFERGPAVRYPNPHNSIVSTLYARNDAALTAVVVERLETKHPMWISGRDAFMRALLAGGHTVPSSLTDTSPCARATTLRLSLARDPKQCDVARDLMQFVETYMQLERREQSYGPPEFDALIATMRAHNNECATCRLEWVRLLFRIKRGSKTDDFPRRMSWMAPSELEALTGAKTDDALWAWLGQQP